MGSSPMKHMDENKCWKSMWHLNRHKFQFRLETFSAFFHIYSKMEWKKAISSWINKFHVVKKTVAFFNTKNKSYASKLHLMFSQDLWHKYVCAFVLYRLQCAQNSCNHLMLFNQCGFFSYLSFGKRYTLFLLYLDQMISLKMPFRPIYKKFQTHS